jgi:pimeloyl-ACP methyl ester carboxylesterase
MGITRILRVLAGLLVLGYLGAIGYLRVNEKAFVFEPAQRHVRAPASVFALGERRVTYPSTDGVTLSAWIVPAAAARASNMWLLICHGNLGNIGYRQRPEYYALIRDLGINLLAFDYRGFGESTGIPDESGLYADATASYEYLTRILNVPPERLVVFGHSLGSGVAIELASRVPVAGLIVEGAFTSVVDRGQELFPLFPVALIATQRFASLDRIASIGVPKLLLHSPEDRVIPYAHGRRLFEAARGPKRLVDVRGGHDDAFRIDRAVYAGAISELFREVMPATLDAPSSAY